VANEPEGSTPITDLALPGDASKLTAAAAKLTYADVLSLRDVFEDIGQKLTISPTTMACCCCCCCAVP
jgi:hypothetical protein